MTLSLRRRAALALTGAMVSAPLWATAVVSASPIIVTFSGQPLLTGPVSCPSTPSVSSITVPAGATVNFADRLGVAATLYAGDSHTHLKDGQMVPVTFRTGPMTVQMWMLPDCSTLDLGSHETMTVSVTAGPGKTDGSGGPGTGTGSTRGATPGVPKPSQSSAHTANPGHTTPDAQPPSVPSVGGIPGGGPTPRPQDTTGSGSVAIGVASDGPSRGASGLLTLIATVSLVGVSAAAIRAIIAQRASRALTA